MDTRNNREKINLLKDIIRHPYAWPGSYERIAIMDDGAIVCAKCLQANYKNILHSTKYNYRDGWQLDGSAIEAVDPESTNRAGVELSYCESCNKHIGELA